MPPQDPPIVQPLPQPTDTVTPPTVSTEPVSPPVQPLTLPAIPKPPEDNEDPPEYMPEGMKKLPKLRDDQVIYRFVGEDNNSYDVTHKEKLFVEHYLKMYGNRVDAIVEAGYDVYYRDKQGQPTLNVNYNMARVMASQNLTKPHIVALINLMMEDFGYNDRNVEKQHNFLINQHDNLTAKGRGLDMYYKIKGQYAPEKHEVIFSEFDKMSDDELAKLAGVPATTGDGNNPPAGTTDPSVQK